MRFALLIPLFALASPAAADEPLGPFERKLIAAEAQPPEPKLTGFALPDGTVVRVVDREKMRLKGAKKFALNEAPGASAEVPDAPATFDYATGKDGKPIAFPMHGNNQYGDCFYVAPVHMTESIRGVWGKPVTFNDREIINRYLKVAGGDNGMYDDQILPEWKQGIVGPNGPHKILDYATIDPADTKSVKAVTYHLGGCVTTHSLRTTWMASVREGAVWTNDGRIDPRAGHAIHCCGVNPAGNFVMTTWGLKVQLTPAGLANSDAEVIAVVALDWFDAKGFTPNGTHYDRIAEFWLAGTGRRLPTGIFPAPEPVVPPTPKPPVPPAPVPVGKGVTGVETVVIVDGVIVGKTWTPGVAPLPVTPNVNKDTHEIDLSHLGPVRRAIVKRKILAQLEDNDHVDYSVKGDRIILTRKVDVDWDKFLGFLERLIPLILKIIELFGGLGDVEPAKQSVLPGRGEVREYSLAP